MSHRESDDDYDDIVAQIDPKTRVIVCKDDYQWIVQTRNNYQWRSDKFCTSREGVLRWVKPHPAILALPDRFKSRRQRRPTTHGAQPD